MKIVHIITRLILGGAQENTLITCKLLAERGHEVTLITGPAIGPEGQLFDQTKGQKYQTVVVDEMCRAINPAKDYVCYGRLKELLRELKPDIVHTHSAKAGILGRYAAWSLKGQWAAEDSPGASCIPCMGFPSIPTRGPGSIASTSPLRRPPASEPITSSASPTR